NTAVVVKTMSDAMLTVRLDATARVEAPTCIAIARDSREPVAFGNDCNSVDPEKSAVFHQFKMSLYEDRADVESLESTDRPAMRIPVRELIATVLRFISRRVATFLRERRVTVLDERTRWVLTVPGICSDRAKAVMRSAATDAGLIDGTCGGRLLLVSEPEAAALESQAALRILTTGMHFAVLDCHEGAIDTTAFTVQRVDPSLTLEQLARTSRGGCGSTMIDKELLRVLQLLLFGNETSEKELQVYEMLSVLEGFDRAKRGFRSGPVGVGSGAGAGGAGGAKRVNLTDLLDVLDISPHTLPAKLEAYNRLHAVRTGTGPLSMHRSALILGETTMRAMYKACLDAIGAHVDELLTNPMIRQCTVFILAGG
ncbi:MAG: hypothetical protein Q8N51_04480, partial [Gammaproteobacteria bacterium]|nr:hypothetical protein [Gammaproteobacteria bacterium]